MAKRAIVKITTEFLRQMLKLPDSVSVVHVSQDSADFSAARFSVYIAGEAEGMPEVLDGNVAPWVNIEVRQIDEMKRDVEFVRVM